MANLIIAIAAFAVLFTGATTFASNWLSSAASNADAFASAAEQEGDIRRTELTHIPSCETPLGTTVEFSFANTGQTSLQNFDDWDAMVYYYSDGSPLIKSLSYTDAATPSADQWTISQISQPNGQDEVIAHDVINTGEEARVIVELSSAMWAQGANRLVLATGNGTTLDVGLSGENDCGFYLNNFPTPPSGTTASQADLPLGTAYPSQPTLYNYDTDRDSQAGLLVVKGGSGPDETDLTKYQNWETDVLAEDLTLSGTIAVDIWAAVKNFSTVSAGEITVHLLDLHRGSYTEIASKTVLADPWDAAASGTFVKKTVQISDANYTVRIGSQLEVRIVVGSGADDDMWFAYDTLSYPARITFPSVVRLLFHAEQQNVAGATYYTLGLNTHDGGFYLHNNPTPPTSATDRQANLPWDPAFPATCTLYDYDDDKGKLQGRKLKKGGSGPNEGDLNDYQNWRTGVLNTDLTIRETVQIQFWAAMKNFSNLNAGEVTVYLRDFDGASYTEIANATVSDDPWDPTGGATWVKKLIEIPDLNYTVQRGHQLELKLIVPASSDDEMWFAYDIVNYASVLKFWADSEPRPEGRPVTLTANAGSGTGRFRATPNEGRFVFPLDGYTDITTSTDSFGTDPGFVWLQDSDDISLSVTSSWQDIDLSSLVPTGTSGAIVEIINTGTTIDLSGVVRGKDDTRDYMSNANYEEIEEETHRWQIVKVDSARKIQGFIEHTDIDFKLLGYTVGSDPDYFTVPPDITPGTTGSWTDVDVSAHVDADADGVILLIDSIDNGDKDFAIREIGSGDNTTNLSLEEYGNTMYMVGIDGSDVFEARIQDSNVKIYLVAQTKGSVVYYVDDIPLPDPNLNVWAGFDADTYDVPPEANGLIFHVENKDDGGSDHKIGFVHVDSLDTSNGDIGGDTHFQATVGVRDDEISGNAWESEWDQYQEHNDVDVTIAAYTRLGRSSGWVATYRVKREQVGFHWFESAIDITPTGAESQWVDIDLSSCEREGMRGAIVQMINDNKSGRSAMVRGKEDTRAYITAVPDGQLASKTNRWQIVEVDSDGLIEAFLEEAGKNERSFVRFDVSSIPGGATVDSATLTLCADSVPGAQRNYDAHQVTESWVETTITWANQPAVSATTTDTSITPASAGCMTWTVDDDVQSWVDGTGNNGWRISDSVEFSTVDYKTKFRTRENGTVNERPKLDVTYDTTESISVVSVADSQVKQEKLNENKGTDDKMEVRSLGEGKVDMKLMGYTEGDDPDYYTTPPDITPGTTGSWTAVDVTAHVDADTTGVILLVDNLTGADRVYGIREIGSSFSDTSHVLSDYGNTMYMVGIDSADQFDAYIQDSNVKIYLVAQTKNSVVYYTNDTAVTDVTDAWTQVDADTYSVPLEANGVILYAENSDGKQKKTGFRHGDSGDDFKRGIWGDGHLQAAVGLNDDNEWGMRMKDADKIDVAIAAYTVLTAAGDFDANASMNVLIRQSNGDIRTTLATDVANTTDILLPGWQTKTATFVPDAYVIQDPTDYLEINLFIDVTRNDSPSTQLHFRIDDNGLKLEDQTSISNVALRED